MRILHVAALSMDKSAGPTYSVPSFVRAQSKVVGVTSHLLITNNTIDKDQEFYYKENFDKKKLFIEFLTSYDLVVFHSTYIMAYVKIARILEKEKIPYIIVPRGGFTKGAKNIKKLKKKVGDLLVFNRFFNSPDAIHFLTEMEMKESVYKTNKDFVLPNGIAIPNHTIQRSYDKNNIKIVFVGRIDSYHKGLDILLEAVGLIKEELKQKNATLNLYGPDVRESKKQLNNLISSLSLQGLVKINEPVFSEEKAEVLHHTDIFIQTSRFEGLPMGVLEALSYGVPCILTPGTNISRKVSDYGGGIEVALDPVSISEGIIEMLKNLEEENNFQHNALKLAKVYSWENIAKSSIEKYREIIAGQNLI